MSIALQSDVIRRVSDTRIQRCGGSTWVPPPRAWQDIVKAAWPAQWPRAPRLLPGGWCDIVLALSAHVSEVDPGAKFNSAYQGSMTGSLDLRMSFTVQEVHEVSKAYEWISRSTCEMCGKGSATRRETTMSSSDRWSQKLIFIRCDAHAVL